MWGWALPGRRSVGCPTGVHSGIRSPAIVPLGWPVLRSFPRNDASSACCRYESPTQNCRSPDIPDGEGVHQKRTSLFATHVTNDSTWMCDLQIRPAHLPLTELPSKLRSEQFQLSTNLIVDENASVSDRKTMPSLATFPPRGGAIGEQNQAASREACWWTLAWRPTSHLVRRVRSLPDEKRGQAVRQSLDVHPAGRSRPREPNRPRQPCEQFA